MNFPPGLTEIATHQPYPLLFATLSGAHLYGFPSPDSDYDLRGVHILPLGEVVGLVTGPETIEHSTRRDGIDLDLVTHEVHKFFRLLLRRNGYVLEQLLSPLVVQTTPAHQALVAIAPACITRHHSHHYLGFAQTQWRLFEREQPRRVKPLLYGYRVLLTGIHLMQTGSVEANLAMLNEQFQLPYIPELIERKVTGAEKSLLPEADLAFHQVEHDRLCQILKEAAARSHLPEEPVARQALHELLVQLRLGKV
ncbi:nucleotidyltransferase [Leptolyngbya sp. 'hensonii']|uniref:nucleotidyltransferase domain-containing protein n=1 Tax=Leptolyngbya sp. 'hensonii' TaxID=1922337 RepID=UPI00094F7D48|nr:nucleotidyltransferase domain-containing protein [Leptolyngbya sp. 'hensonii']OLP17661.1 nucleotidyltransferase [Leptolyngbya sp. 'hensonii']